MRLLRVILLFVIASAASFSGAVFARELTADEKASLAQVIDAFDNAMHNKDIPTIVAVVPPKVFVAIAKQSGVDEQALVAEVVRQTTEVMKDVTFETFGMDVEKAIYKETPDGMPYALIPTEMVMNLGEKLGKVKATSHTFGLLDEGKWYLIRTDDAATLEIVKQVYPSYAAEVFPAGTTEPVTQ